MIITLDLFLGHTIIKHVCTVTQYYGYYSTEGDKSKVYYDSGWSTNYYFVSSSLVAYLVGLIQQVDSQIPIGQLSYKQISEIFNYNHCNQLRVRQLKRVISK